MSYNNGERQKRYRDKKRLQRLTLPHIKCACGCGELIPYTNSHGRPAKYKWGHVSKVNDYGGRFQKGQEPWNKGKPCPYLIGNKHGLGYRNPNPKPISEETRKKLSESHKGQKSWNKGGTLPPEVRSKISKTLMGHRHSPETIAKMTGSNNHSWRGGASVLPYGPGFTRSFKKLIRKRDGNKCQRCGKTRERNWRSLEVHHIDHEKMNNDPTNLITVCSQCNLWLSNNRDESLRIFPKRKMLI